MERFILKKLLNWKNSPYRKPLILKGVRQVGKTWVLKEFGKRYYESTAYFNFDENEEYKQFFETTKDVDRILQNLMLASGQKIIPEKTLIIFDEIQDCPKVINSMKYFCENAPQYHIACAGSLLGIALAKPSSFPVGKVNFMQIDPMTFTEFLLANGDENLANYLEMVNTIEPIPDAFFNPLYEKLKMYYVTGGMPEPVQDVDRGTGCGCHAGSLVRDYWCLRARLCQTPQYQRVPQDFNDLEVHTIPTGERKQKVYL